MAIKVSISMSSIILILFLNGTVGMYRHLSVQFPALYSKMAYLITSVLHLLTD